MAISWFTIGALTIVCALLLLVVIFEIVKLIMSVKKKQDHALTYRMIVLVIPLIALSVAGYFEFRQQYPQYMATIITRRVVGNDNVTARCVRGGEFFNRVNFVPGLAGQVTWGATYSEIERTDCHNFYAWLMSDKMHADEGQIFALHVIIHEAVHLTGEHDEAETTYKATKWYEDIAVSLGASRDEAKRMNDYFKVHINPRQPSPYQVDFEAREREEAETREAE